MRGFQADSRPNPWEFLNDPQTIRERIKNQKPVTPEDASFAFRDKGSESARIRMIERHKNKK